MFLAGPNGSGKSTFAAASFIRELVQTPEDPPSLHIDPDAILRSLRARARWLPRRVLEGWAAALADWRLRKAIAGNRSVIRETVLSTHRLLPVVEKAKAAGFRFLLLFVVVRHPDLAVERVDQRVKLGGHPVPADRIRKRWERAMQIMPEFAGLAETYMIIDNSERSTGGLQQAGPKVLVVSTPEQFDISIEAGYLANRECADDEAPLRELLRKLILQLTPDT
jgi:predicted ABC-type ATPase